MIHLLLLATLADGRWLEWGGPGRDFHVAGETVAAWPAGGPKKLWSRPLGDGYSAILADGPTLYTVFRREKQNVATALDAATGRTIWERPFDATPLPDMFLSYGSGPNATPLLVNGRLFVVTFTGTLAALDPKSGAVLWTQELWKTHGGTFRDVGYSSSPLAYRDWLILPVGGAGKGVFAFRQSDGGVAWKRTDFENAMSSPLLVRVDGEEQVVLFMVDHVIGLNPLNGDLVWSHPHKTEYAVNSSTPVWSPETGTLVISSAYGTGARALKLTHAGPKTVVTELWANTRFRVHHGNMLRIGEYVYGSSGDFGPAPMTAVHIPTGTVAWQDRHFPKSTMLYADGKAIVLDEDGRLALATLSPTGMTVLGEASVLTKTAWTVPTLAGGRLFVRDRATVAAFAMR
jgi:outer membrane protein assembly factor BamB